MQVVNKQPPAHRLYATHIPKIPSAVLFFKKDEISGAALRKIFIDFNVPESCVFIHPATSVSIRVTLDKKHLENVKLGLNARSINFNVTDYRVSFRITNAKPTNHSHDLILKHLRDKLFETQDVVSLEEKFAQRRKRPDGKKSQRK